MTLAATFVTLLAALLAPQDPTADPLAAALARAGGNRAELERALAVVPAAQRPSLAFLIEHMPERDLRGLTADFLLADVALAHAARTAAPWQATITDELFLDWLLPYAQIDETREAWRAALRSKCLPLIEGCTTAGDAALRLNEKLFPLLGARYSTARKKANQSPSETIAQGLASCTGLSILLADACRSVGVPARLAGIGSWPESGGNHTWVEVWDGSAWRYLGAAEPDPQGFDRAWFSGKARTAVPGDPRQGIFANCWRSTGARFPLGRVPGVEVTARYRQDPDAAHGDDALLAQMQRFYRADAAEQVTFAFDRNLDAELRSKTGDARLRALAWRAFVTLPHAELHADHAANLVRAGDKESPFTWKQVGEKPAPGWPLVIAMHGGGGAPQAVNDQQWRHMQIYYKDHPEASGYLYCALRAPTNDWNGFYTDYVYPLIERLILQFAVCAEVDPDKVFAIGYSHGGYGAFAIGPKLPDRFAAVHASASAPTDGETSPVGLHTLRFSFMVGEKDTAYGRLERCRKFDGLLQELKQANPGEYPATFAEIAGNGHGGLPDRDRLQDLLPLVRNAQPRDLHWQLTDGVVRDHYWLSVPQAQKGPRLDAKLQGQRLEVTLQGCTSATAHLDARLLDPNQPLTVVCNGQEQQVALQPSLRQLCADLLRRGDPVLAGSCAVELVAGKVEAPLALRIRSSDVLLAFAEGWAAAYPGAKAMVTAKVTGGGSGAGFAAFAVGEADLALATRRLADQELAAARASGTEPVEVLLGYQALAICVHPENPLPSITLDQLREVYGKGGKLTGWSQLGVTAEAGMADEIMVVSLQTNTAACEFFRAKTLGRRDLRLGTVDLSRDQDVVAMVRSTRRAIGYCEWSRAAAGIRCVPIIAREGDAAVLPGETAIANGDYPLARAVYAYYRDEPTGRVKAFVRWLREAEGRAVLQQHGFVPAK